MLTTTRRTRSLLTLAAVAVLTGGLFGALLPALSGAGAQAATPATATPPAPLVGFNENWNTQAGLTQILTDADIAALKKTGATSVRFPVRCNTVGACAFTSRNNDSIDFSKVTTWNWTQLDAAVAKLLAAGITPIVGPHPGDRMYRPGWIVDDAMFASTKAYVTNIASHLAAKFGPLPYSMFETDLTTSLTTGLDGVQRYRYLTAQGFPASFAAGLAQLYPNVAALNAAYGTAYPSFAMVPVPDLGSSLGVPSTVFDSPATTDLRKIIGTLSAGRYSTIGQAIHAASPGSEFWGPTVQLQSFDDSRQVHTNTLLTPVGPTLSDLAGQPGIDVLSVDGYRNDSSWTAAAEWRIAAKTAARAGKKLAITEVGDGTLAGLNNAVANVERGASNLRAVLVWQAKDDPSANAGTFGMIDALGNVRSDRSAAVTSFFSTLTTQPAYQTYTPGAEAVYYPEWALQVVQSGKLTTTKTLALMSDLMKSGYPVEPVVDSDIVAGAYQRLSVYSLYLGDTARAALAAAGGTKPTVVFQYASERTRFAGGKPVDSPLWPGLDSISVSAPEVTARAAETASVLGQAVPVALDLRLQGWPFVHFTGWNPNNAVIATHAAALCGCALAVRTPSGSVWSDEYLGAAAIPAIYAKP